MIRFPRLFLDSYMIYWTISWFWLYSEDWSRWLVTKNYLTLNSMNRIFSSGQIVTNDLRSECMPPSLACLQVRSSEFCLSRFCLREFLLGSNDIALQSRFMFVLLRIWWTWTVGFFELSRPRSQAAWDMMRWLCNCHRSAKRGQVEAGAWPKLIPILGTWCQRPLILCVMLSERSVGQCSCFKYSRNHQTVLAWIVRFTKHVIKGHLKQVDTHFTGRLIEIPKRIINKFNTLYLRPLS